MIIINCWNLNYSSATNRLITSKDHASVQINVGHLDERGVYTGGFTTFALCGFVRAQVAFSRFAFRVFTNWHSCILCLLYDCISEDWLLFLLVVISTWLRTRYFFIFLLINVLVIFILEEIHFHAIVVLIWLDFWLHYWNFKYCSLNYVWIALLHY